jgi:homogentisate 1,2-dioxygenase
VDTFRPLDLGEGGVAAEDPAYAWTWAGGSRASGSGAAPDTGQAGRGPEDGGAAVFSNS